MIAFKTIVLATTAVIAGFTQADSSNEATAPNEYGLVCNAGPNLETESMELCQRGMSTGDVITYHALPKDGIKLCHYGGTWVSGRTLDNSKDSYATNRDVAAAIGRIRVGCGIGGGSASANGDQAGLSFIVHVNDHFV